jgi:hypothetical protein
VSEQHTAHNRQLSASAAAVAALADYDSGTQHFTCIDLVLALGMRNSCSPHQRFARESVHQLARHTLLLIVLILRNTICVVLIGGEGVCASGDEQSDRVTQSNWRANSTAASPTRRSDPSLQHGGNNGSSNSSTPGNTAHGRSVVTFTLLVWCTHCAFFKVCIRPFSATHCSL